MPVEVELGQAGNVNPEGIGRVNIPQKAGVQAMNPLQNDDIAFAQTGNFSILAHPGNKVVMRKLNFLTSEQSLNIVVQTFQVHGA